MSESKVLASPEGVSFSESVNSGLRPIDIPVTFEPKPGSAKFYLHDRLSSLLQENMAELGNVKLESFTVKFMATAAKQEIRLILHSELREVKYEGIFSSPGGKVFVSNEHTIGIEQFVQLLVPSSASVQLQPASSTHPMLKFMIVFSKDMQVSAHIRVLSDSNPVMPMIWAGQTDSF